MKTCFFEAKLREQFGPPSKRGSSLRLGGKGRSYGFAIYFICKIIFEDVKSSHFISQSYLVLHEIIIASCNLVCMLLVQGTYLQKQRICSRFYGLRSKGAELILAYRDRPWLFCKSNIIL